VSMVASDRWNRHRVVLLPAPGRSGLSRNRGTGRGSFAATRGAGRSIKRVADSDLDARRSTRPYRTVAIGGIPLKTTP
jgi:hypothetical protein